MKFGIVVLPGSNCDHDALHVTRDVLGACNAQECIVKSGLNEGETLGHA